MTVGALQRFEQRLESAVEGAFARAFRSAVQPMEIAAALQREVDSSAQALSRNRRIAHNSFTIELSAGDFDRLSAYGETLSAELASMLHEYAGEQGYAFAGPVQLNFHRFPELTTGRFHVKSTASANVESSLDAPEPAAPAVAPAPSQPPEQPASPAPAPAPQPSPADVSLEINGTSHPLRAPGVVLGRGSNADIRIDDPGVSRRHAEFRMRGEGADREISVVDLGSTNGTTVNGHRVQHAGLNDGDVIQIGSTTVHLRGGSPAHAPSTYDHSAPSYAPAQGHAYAPGAYQAPPSGPQRVQQRPSHDPYAADYPPYEPVPYQPTTPPQAAPPIGYPPQPAPPQPMHHPQEQSFGAQHGYDPYAGPHSPHGQPPRGPYGG